MSFCVTVKNIVGHNLNHGTTTNEPWNKEQWLNSKQNLANRKRKRTKRWNKCAGTIVYPFQLWKGGTSDSTMDESRSRTTNTNWSRARPEIQKSRNDWKSATISGGRPQRTRESDCRCRRSQCWCRVHNLDRGFGKEKGLLVGACWSLLHDNAPIHNSIIVREFLAKRQVTMLFRRCGNHQEGGDTYSKSQSGHRISESIPIAFKSRGALYCS